MSDIPSLRTAVLVNGMLLMKQSFWEHKLSIHSENSITFLTALHSWQERQLSNWNIPSGLELWDAHQVTLFQGKILL